jgi:hypothetical protein
MPETNEDKYRKIVRDFKGRMEFMNRTPPEDAVKIFFEICDIGINNYIRIEKERFPNKSIKEIVLEMHNIREKTKTIGRKNRWK